MSQLDVKELANDHLPQGKFPASPRADFRLHIAPEVRRGIEQHANADKKVEICGVLVGNWHSDENGPYVAITNYIRCDNASSKFAEVTFTHESWAQINKEMDSKFANERIVGWYHSHPDFGIFLSDRDCFIHEHFFSGAGQVAYVIDPVRGLEGMFAWRNGKPTPLPHFWVGNSIRTVEASERNVTAETAARAATAGSNAMSQAGPAFAQSSLGSIGVTAMGVLLVFLLGYFYGGWRSQWERQMIVDGVVAYFANAKILRPGLEDNLAQVRERLKLLPDELVKLPPPSATLSKEQIEDSAKRLKTISDNLTLCDAKLTDIEKVYGYSDEERKALALFIQHQEAEIRRMAEAAAKPKAEDSSATNAPQPKQEKSATSGVDADKKTPSPDTTKPAPSPPPGQPMK